MKMRIWTIVDKNGEYFKEYESRGKAEVQAEMLNEDISFEHLAPFDVQEIYED
jgi:hypothetical protein